MSSHNEDASINMTKHNEMTKVASEYRIKCIWPICSELLLNVFTQLTGQFVNFVMRPLVFKIFYTL